VNERQLDWVAQIVGPPNTPYEGGVFTLDLFFSEAYPFKPPRTSFRTPVFHANVSMQGKICLNWLNDDWSPLLTVLHLLQAITQLFGEPNLADPLNVMAAELYRRNRAKYDETAREWTEKYALKELLDDSLPGCVREDPVAVYQTGADGVPLDEEAALRRILEPETQPAPKQAPAPSRWQHEKR
jgi:ubiquitin-conjugating enzyme E2 D/E